MSLLFHDVYRQSPNESGFCSAGADRYKLSAEQFDRQLDGAAHACLDRPILAPQLSDTEVERGVSFAITVDDGGVSYYTVIADALEKRGWRGHAFISTDFIGRPGFLTEHQLRELDARGHVIGSHSASHPARFSACHRQDMVREWSVSKRVLEDLLGHEVLTASLPGGYFSDAVAETAAEAGFRVLFTSEPITRLSEKRGCTLAGRFAVRAGVDAGFSRRLVEPAHWTRSEEWASWRMKGLLKPMLGPLYSRLADRVAPLLRT